MKWQKGETGNAKGRPVGTGKHERLRAVLATHIPDILDALAAMAKGGDVHAARLLLERTLPPLRPVDASMTLELSPEGGLSEQGRAVLAALAAGHLPVNQATGILQALAAQAKLIETDELERRIAALEGKP